MDKIIALITDLGNKDYFVGAMKGAILSVNPSARIVDITHEVPKFDVPGAAFTLLQAAKAFPENSIFVVVVDPGVGTERKCVLLETKNGMMFIAPDNGVLTLVSRGLGMGNIYQITNRELMRREISPTFHGRDIMAPVAARLSMGLKAGEVGPRLKNIKLLELPQPRAGRDEIRGHVTGIDDFGNLVTDIDGSMVSGLEVGGDLLISMAGKKIPMKMVRTFGDVAPGQYLCYIGSSGMLELAKNMGDLTKELKVKNGAEFTVKRVS